MRRRDLLAAGCAVAFRPCASEAQPAAQVPRIGFLFYAFPGPSPEIEAFRQGLADLGYHEDQNIIIQYRFASGRIEQLPELAAELVGLEPAVIVSTNTPSSVALKQATSTIPIVFAGIADAVGAGLVTNFARPGGNITGFTSLSAELSGKRLGLLKGVVPNVSRVAVLYNPADRSNVLMFEEFQASTPRLALTLHAVPVKEPGEFDAAFATMARDRADALFGTAGVLTLAHRKPLWISPPRCGYRRCGAIVSLSKSVVLHLTR
jgi:putative ABC transport system substrate-binding protein